MRYKIKSENIKFINSNHSNKKDIIEDLEEDSLQYQKQITLNNSLKNDNDEYENIEDNDSYFNKDDNN